MKNLITILILALLSLPLTSTATKYGPTIPALPKDGVLYHADVIDCNPEDYEADDPHFYVGLGYIWAGDITMYALVFYLNNDITENRFKNPTAIFYGSSEQPTIFVRVVNTVERFEGFKPFVAKYPKGICSIPRPDEEI